MTDQNPDKSKNTQAKDKPWGGRFSESTDAFVEEFNRVFDQRRQSAYEVFNSIPGVHCLMPEATFLIWVNTSQLGSSDEVSRLLRTQQTPIVFYVALGLKNQYLQFVYLLMQNWQIHKAYKWP